METEHEAINIALTIENGVVTNVRQIRKDEHIASLDTFLWIVKRAGYEVIPPQENTQNQENIKIPAEVE
ncbi:hypothetical protein FMK90_25635 [Klebsiella grimontii]|uniref:hypothetical protein n=1 Tax=Klebsiella grimontii TaxID=2058152 RepID=UPI001C88E220|nr:hypothetical protein [Klebsiella grimontii]MBW5985585.1 hypothetical protein [Klebsiella michiganensis]MBW6001820.1 hypothetical protein [Klebsiella michiganensis]MBX4827275.1 hypothetical protein [Klebsiella grimontii]MBZ6688978.1 hypothetical protein [Klebsiella grimontii]MBZ7346359.1 hypothetical protein [Klebsiella grimontii]